jgi:hypothetical protein
MVVVLLLPSLLRPVAHPTEVPVAIVVASAAVTISGAVAISVDQRRPVSVTSLNPVVTISRAAVATAA